ncbi:class E sortase [Streptomyces sirii]|uniref:class E sortase n=1 Tax=Streptomyces sirii TaxID=3127701 RepID=UPI003D361E26
MTALRPEREGRPYDPYEPEQPNASQEPRGSQDPYGRPDAFEAAVGQLDDPLNDPLPGQASPPPTPAPASPPTPTPTPSLLDQPGRGRRRGKPAEEGLPGSPWFRPQPAQQQRPQQTPQRQAPAAPPAPRGPQPFGPESAAGSQGQSPSQGPRQGRNQRQGRVPGARAGHAPYSPTPTPSVTPPATPSVSGPAPSPAAQGPDDETMALRQAEKRGGGTVSRETEAAVSRETSTSVSTAAAGGRAARRKAAQEAAKRGGRRGRRGDAVAATAAAETASEPTSAPTSRLEARRAARAAKDSPSLIVSRALGEVFITLGVLMLLFVTYQLWWTNVMAEQEAGGAANNLQHEWDKGGGEKKNLAAGERFGIMYIPKLDVKAPIAEGIDKPSVLDHGMVGHYDKSSGLKTAMPWDKKGNFAVAAHRNTHGEPFRYINKLTKGDKIIVETQSSYYTYEMESILPQTSPSNTSVIGPVPPGSGFTGPGRYITLTTCTPEFTSTFRMIVWGKMVDERPRSKGKPEALAG